jgi:CelD/BcsL family acetyltransferase involved in cellulose biosynthesis
VLIEDRASLAGLRAPWRAMAEATGNAFLTPEWYETWCDHYGQEDRPFVAAVVGADDGRLVGLLPLVCRGREIRFAGHNVGDLFAPLAAPGAEDEVVRSVAEALAGAHIARDRRPRLVFDNVDRDAPWLDTLADAWPGRLASTEVLTSVLPRALLSGRSWDDFLASRTRNFRSQLGRRIRGLDRDYTVTFRLADDPARLGADMQVFFFLHDARWQSRGGSSSQGARCRDFHRAWAARALARGWLRLWFLELDGRPVAAWYGWRVGGRYSYYLAGFDPAFADRCPGLILLAHTVHEAFQEGADVYDLMLGDEPYKERFCDVKAPVATVVMAGSFDPAIWRARGASGVRTLAGRMPDGVRPFVRSAARAAHLTLPGARTR